jgi:methylated-DNA-[protein]-cysteine S-methyltransferase
VYFTYCDSPIGKLLLAGDAQALRIISLPNDRHHLVPADDWQQSDDALHNAVEQLCAYFAGDLHEFELPVDPGGTEFQRQVWKALRAIPYGTTVSYGENWPSAWRNPRQPVRWVPPTAQTLFRLSFRAIV